MANRVVMPKLTDTMEEGVLLRWYKKEGESIESGDPIAEVETDKAIMDLEAFASGILKKILVSEGATVPSGNLIAIIAREDEEIDTLIAEEIMPKRVGAESPPPHAGMRPPPAFSGIEEIIAKGGAHAGITVELSIHRKTTAKRMMESKGPVPHFYVVSEIDMEKALAFKARIKQTGLKLKMTEIFLKAAALTLRKFPAYRSSYLGQHVRISEKIDVGFAVGIKEGVITPVICDCDHKPLSVVSEEVRDKIRRATEKGLAPSEYTGAVFSISNLGMYDVESFSAIITPPESGVLAIGSILEKPVVRDQAITIGNTVKVTLATDHRVADGMLAAQFLSAFKNILQEPERLI